MKALVISDIGKAEFQEIDTPRPGAGEVLIKVRYAGLCGSDLNTFRGKNPLVNLPRIPGHEIGGRIVEAGSSTFERTWEPDSLTTIIFGSYTNTSNGVSGMVYEELEVTASAAKFDEYLADYNLASTKPMNLVFFTDACLHLARLSRVITQPRGCSLLVGVGGSGRQSLARLAANMWEMKCLGIEITRTYDMVAWHDDLKTFMFAAGLENKPTVFLFSDTQIIKVRAA